MIIFLHIITGLLYTPFMLRCLGQNEYGLYSLVASIITYLTLLDFGFGSAIVRYTAKIRAVGTKTQEWELYGMFASAYVVIGVLAAIGGFVLYANVDNMFDHTMADSDLHQAKVMMALMTANLALTFPLSIFGSIVTAYERFIFVRSVSIIRILLSTAVLVTVLALGFKAIALVVVQTVFSIATLLLNLWYCRQKLKVKIRIRHFNLPLLKEIMIFSWWNFVGAIVDRIYWGTGQFVLGAVSGTVAVAIFSLAVSLQSMYMSMSTSLSGVLLPRLTSMVARNADNKQISDLFLRTGRLQFAVLALILSGFIVFGHDFILLWAGADYNESYFIALIFFTALICPLIQNVGISILQARGQQKFRSMCYFFIAVVSLAAQIWLGRSWGAIGCAVAIGITLFVGQWVIMNIYYAKRQHLAIVEFWREIGRMAIIPILFATIGIIARYFVDITSWGMLGGGIVVFTVLYIPAFYRFSLNTYERGLFRAPFVRVQNALSHHR